MEKLEANILVVDDEEIFSRMLERLLGFFGCTCTSKENGKEGVEEYCRAMFTGRPYDAGIVDMKMPFMDGKEAAKQIKEVDPEAKLIVSTAMYDDVKVIENYRDYGFQERVIKPYTMDNLYDALKRVLKK
ncbi:response regulator [Candidatus Woesearchaeota archaeon]|nr:response regulator [Candidatus Woesearchaeota archaeon]